MRSTAHSELFQHRRQRDQVERSQRVWARDQILPLVLGIEPGSFAFGPFQPKQRRAVQLVVLPEVRGGASFEDMSAHIDLSPDELRSLASEALFDPKFLQDFLTFHEAMSLFARLLLWPSSKRRSLCLLSSIRRAARHTASQRWSARRPKYSASAAVRACATRS